MSPDFTMEELVTLKNHLTKELKHFRHSPTEWDFWNSSYMLDELDMILKKITHHLQKEKSNEVI